MKLLSSLRSRIFLTSALLAVLSIGAAIYLVSVRVTRELEDSLNREILSTRRLVERLRTDRTRTFTAMARLIADTPKLKAAVDTDDPPTVQENAIDYQTQLNSNLLLVTNKAGEVLATVGLSPPQALVVASEPAVRNALRGQESYSLLAQPGGILQVVAVPIAVGSAPPDILGALGVGFLLDDALAEQLKEITGSEMAFGMGGQVLSSTLSSSLRPALAALLRAGEGPQNVTLDSEEFVATPLPLEPTDKGGAAGTGPIALILRSRTEQLHFLQAIHTELAVTAVFAVLLATLLSFAVARTITTPLAAITDVMREVAATGDLTRKIVLRGGERWDDEDARLLANTFNSLTDSVARFQREISQKERLSSLGRLSTVIAHEVRNPLMIIKAALHTVRRPDVDRRRGARSGGRHRRGSRPAEPDRERGARLRPADPVRAGRRRPQRVVPGGGRGRTSGARRRRVARSRRLGAVDHRRCRTTAHRAGQPDCQCATRGRTVGIRGQDRDPRDRRLEPPSWSPTTVRRHRRSGLWHASSIHISRPRGAAPGSACQSPRTSLKAWGAPSPLPANLIGAREIRIDFPGSSMATHAAPSTYGRTA